MKKHVKAFLKSRKLSGHEPYWCEWCGKHVSEARFLDCHHIERRGIGGNKDLDVPENLIALCREPCHKDADANKIPEEVLKKKVEVILLCVNHEPFYGGF